MLRIRIFFWILLLLAVFPCAAQHSEVTVTACFDTSRILVGDHLRLQLSAQTTMKTGISFQSKEDWRMMNCEVLDASDLHRTEKAGKVTYRQEFTVTAFDTGYAVIAPVQVWVDTIPVGCTDTLFFYVDTLPVYVDTAATFRDIKLPLNASEQVIVARSRLWPWVLAGGLALVLGGLAVVFFKIWWPKLKKKRAAQQREKRRESSGTVALEHIKVLKAKELCQKGMVKEHYSELSAILRTYLDDQWDVNAMEMVTDEIITALSSKDVTEQQRLELLAFLRLSDLVKYARRQPALEENALQMDNVTKFIRDTDRQEQAYRAQQAASRKNKGRG